MGFKKQKSINYTKYKYTLYSILHWRQGFKI